MSQLTRWLPAFNAFIKDIRIPSKEVSSSDDRGVPLRLWESQRRYLKQLAEGLDDGIHHHYWLKARQLGCTTISIAIDVFWLAIHPGLFGALVTDSEVNRDANRDLIKRYINSFPPGY